MQLKFIGKYKKKRGNFFQEIAADITEILDDSKERYIVNYLSEGLSNRVLFEKFINFQWPLWLEYTSNPSSGNCRACPNPILLNTGYREWQTFTNYLSSSEITIDRAGMIAGPSASRWSLEFWVYNNGKLQRPQNDPANLKIFRNTKTGEIIFSWETDNYSLTERIAGSRSSVDEALISVELNIRRGGKSGCILAVIRPYNNISLGGVTSIQVDKSAGVIIINNNRLLGFDTLPEDVLTGSGLTGDILSPNQNGDKQVNCSYGMATTALKYSTETGKRILNFRISLNKQADIPVLKLNYSNLFKEFAMFSEMRLSEGIKADLTDSDFTSLFLQCRLSVLNINSDDIDGDNVEVYRKLYFFIYAFCRTGALDAGENFFKQKLNSFIYDKKNITLDDVVKGCFIINSCYEIFIHKRESGFLQVYYPALKGVAEYIYSYSVNLHEAKSHRQSTGVHSFAISFNITESIYIYSAISNISYLARCLGIFGDESKFKNESLRIQSLILDSLKYEEPASHHEILFSLLALPEKVLMSLKHDEYKKILIEIASSKGFPVTHPLFGIDMFSSTSMLNQFFMSGVNESQEYFSILSGYIDDFHVIPDYIDPSSHKGAWGEGNSKVVNAVLFATLRNRLFIDGADRLELFPSPDKKWYNAGSRIRVENATSRYGLISFTLDASGDEIRISFSGSPKYLPPDILVNIPFDTTIIPGDDFIFKKKTGYNYIISGWPSSLRFTI